MTLKHVPFCIIYSVDITVRCACNICFSKCIFSISGRYDSNIKNVILFAACLFVLLSIRMWEKYGGFEVHTHNNTGHMSKIRTRNESEKTTFEKT